MAGESVTLTRTYHFSAAHRLANPALPEAENRAIYGPCFRPHGHNYVLQVTIGGFVDPLTGMSADLDHLDATVNRVIVDKVDHHDLNADVPALDGVITTGENLVRNFWGWLAQALPPGTLRRVALMETAHNGFECLGATADGDPG